MTNTAETADRYTLAERSACVAIFDANVPEHFAATERNEFCAFLDAPRGEYLVLRVDGEVVGCGGYGAIGDELVLCWGMLHPAQHGRGIGRCFLELRVGLAARRFPAARRVRVETSSRARGFYERCGFAASASSDGTVSMTLDLE